MYRGFILLSLFSTSFSQSDSVSSKPAGHSLWSGWGGGLLNSRWASSNSLIDSKSVKGLSIHCQIQYPNGISATPTVGENNTVYYPTWNGLLVALDYETCQTRWTANVSTIVTTYGPPSVIAAFPAPVSRTSPQVDEGNGIVYFGTQHAALMVALDKQTGIPLGAIQINPHSLAVITTSPTLFNGTIYVGASSDEEVAEEIIPGYKCCSFVGNMAALTFDRTGGKFTVQWNTTMIPESVSGIGKWTGAAVWGSQPSIDLHRNQIYIGTGNTYSVPASFDQCERTQALSTNNSESCLPSDIWQESILAISLSTGQPNWVRQLTPLDAWTIACGSNGTATNPSNCPQVPGPDADFGMNPTLVLGSGEGAKTPYGRDTLVAGQKNGVLYALDAETGRTFWATATGPGGMGGGLSWGVAVDRERVYFNAINSNHTDWTPFTSGAPTNGSGYGAVCLEDGNLEWQTAAQGQGLAFGPPSVVGDVMLTTAPVSTVLGGLQLLVGPGQLVILDQKTGGFVDTVTVDAVMHGGIAIQDEYLLFGTGYSGYNSTGSLYVMSVSKGKI
jgi:outer membrane protein assembly factor BamB